MQSEKTISRIREGGVVQGPGRAEERRRLLEELGFRMRERAEYTLLASCYNPYLVPEDMRALARLLDRLGVDYTLLPKEYCCGDPLFLHALDEGHEGDLDVARELAREWAAENLRQARERGSSTIVLYCQACDMVWQPLREHVPERVVWYPHLLLPLYPGGRLELRAHFYPGCHRYRRAYLGDLPDLQAVLSLLARVEGLGLDPLPGELCCLRPDELGKLAGAVRHRTVITPCSGCALFLRRELGEGFRVVLPATVLWAAVSGEEL